MNADKKILSEKLYLGNFTNLGGSGNALNSDFETWCYRLTDWVPTPTKNSDVEILTPYVIVFGDGAFGR